MDSYLPSSLSLFDLLPIGIITLLSIQGFMRGVLREMFGLIGLVIGVYFASCLSVEAGQFIDSQLYHLNDPKILQLLGFLGIFFVFWVSAVLMGKILYTLSHKGELSFLSRFFGWLVSWVKYFVVMSLLIIALSSVKIGEESIAKYTASSQLYPIYKQMTSVLLCFKRK
jgi:membrane protein required for colicin V production